MCAPCAKTLRSPIRNTEFGIRCATISEKLRSSLVKSSRNWKRAQRSFPRASSRKQFDDNFSCLRLVLSRFGAKTHSVRISLRRCGFSVVVCFWRQTRECPHTMSCCSSRSLIEPFKNGLVSLANTLVSARTVQCTHEFARDSNTHIDTSVLAPKSADTVT